MRVSTLATREVDVLVIQHDAKTSEQNRTAWLFRLLFAVLALSSLFLANNAFAQPAAMSINQDVSGTYTNTAMSLQGGAFRARFQENGTGTSSGTRNWQFNADGYFNTWGVLSTNGSSSVTLSGYNSVVVPNAATASANFEGGPGYNSKGRLPATQANFYYTYNIMKGSSYASQSMSVLETSFNPVSLNTVSQSMGVYGGRLVTITTSGTPNAGENIFVRYTTNGFTTSTIIQATGSGSTWSATIPWQTSAVTFYVYSSNRSKSAIDADVTSLSTQEVHDLSTLNLNNSAGANYTYTPLTGNIIVSATGGSTSGTYSSITGASGSLFAALNAGTHTGTVTALITADITTETGTTSLNNLVALTSLGIQPLGARTVSGAVTAGNPLINFNGGDNVTINGLNTGGNSLTISNTTNSATSGTSTIRFIADATNNTITNCTVLGSPSMAVGTNGGVIFFSTGTTTGNDNNTISNCTIGSAGANLASKGIYGNGSTTSAGIGNSGITITNNNFPDIFGAAVSSAGIYCADGCNTWTITNNRFYQTAARTWTTGAQHSPIWLIGTSTTSGSQGFTITGNIIGYGTSTQTGSYTLSGSGAGARFIGIFFNGSSTGATTTVSNNTIASVSMTGVTANGTSTSSPFAAILLQEGVFISNGNTIGSQSTTGSLNFATNTTLGTDVYGIYNFSSNTWTSNNNNIGGFNVANTGTGTLLFYLLRANTGIAVSWTATGNNIGGTVAASIASHAVSVSSQVIGMYSSNAPMLFTSNTVRNMTTDIGTGTASTSSIIGISAATSSVNHTITQSSIYNLSNTNTTAASSVLGIYFQGSTANSITRNLIYGLTASTNSATAEVSGIRIGSGTTTFANNMIALGAGISNAIPINGINEPSATGTDNFYHNSVYIGGTATAGSGASFAFNSLVTTSTRAFRDNIFMNARSNSGATGKHYAVQVGGTAANPAGLTINNNIYYVTGTGGVFGRFNAADVADLTAWKTAVGQDAASIPADPAFNDPTNATPDLHIHPTNVSAAEGAGANVGITDDFDGQTRSGLTPVDIGADAGNFTGAPSMSYVSSTAVQQTGNVCPATANVPVLRMEIVTTGSLNPLTLTSLTLNGTGTSNLADIASYRVYYTGTSSTFSTANPINAAASPLTNSSIVITPSSTVTLAQGTNYFWLAYTLASSVTGPDLDAQFTSVALSTGGGTPTVTNPAGVVTANPSPAAVTVSGGGTFCTSTTITASNGNDGTIYFQGTTSGGTSTATPSTSQTITTSGTYYFRAQSAAGCWGAEGSVAVTIQTPASITTTPASVCINGTGTIAATSATGCVSFVNSGTSISGTWTAATDPVAKRITSSILNTSTCSFDASITRNYVAKQFQVSVTGNYVFEMDDNSGYDGMGYIVTGSFVPGTCPGTGTWIRGDDDDGVSGNEPRLGASGTGSGVMTLTAGVTYTLISTTYSLSSGTISGSFNWTITPPSGGQIMLPTSGSIQWYTAASGGSSIGTGSPFNPVGVVGSPLANTGTAGTTVFYAACSNSSACRTPVNFVINPNTSIALFSAPGTDNQTVCINNAITTISYTVANGGTGASITSGTLPTGVTGSFSAGTFSIVGTPTQSGTFNVTISTSGGCGVATANVTINVTAANTLTLTSAPGTDAQTVCSGASVTPVTYAVGGATGASATGLPSGVNGVFNAG
ncbi:MAG: hypothetical protein JST02_01740, partial [Bacteroidetes bacterium]|nr:hypothetical protein [Bacteroidota bacterium]